MRVLLFLLSFILFSFVLTSQQARADQGAEVYARRYLLYLHGKWIEQHGMDGSHPRHGPYEYDEIVRTFAEKGFVVMSEMRLGERGITPEAKKAASQIKELLQKGVPPDHITVAGHSKGGHMALLAASLLEEEKVNFVILAGCGKVGTRFREGYEKFLNNAAGKLQGRILSLYDAADREAGTCREAFDRAARGESQELVLRTGRGHGLFYSPHPIWVDEVVQWARGEEGAVR